MRHRELIIAEPEWLTGDGPARASIALLLTMLLIGCAPMSKTVDELQGKWKSDAERTLESMRATPGVSEEAKAIFENDFFGHLEVEYRGDTVRMVLDDEDYDIGFMPVEVLEEGDGFVVLSQWNDLLEEFQPQTVYFEGACYYVLTGSPPFREYFCRVDEANR